MTRLLAGILSFVAACGGPSGQAVPDGATSDGATSDGGGRTVTGKYQIYSVVKLDQGTSPGFQVREELFNLLDIPGNGGRICDQTAAAIAEPALRASLQAACTGTCGSAQTSCLVRALSDSTLQISPTLGPKLAALNDAVFDLPGNAYYVFGLHSQLDVTTTDGGLVATHRAPELTVTVGGVATTFPVGELGNAVNITTDVGVTLSGSTLAIARHDLAVPLGALLRAAIDRAVIPTILPDARNLADIYRDQINCDEVGQRIFDETQLGSATQLAAACRIGIPHIADEFNHRLDVIDAAPLDLRIEATVVATDTDNDDRFDHFVGQWTGELIDHAALHSPVKSAPLEANLPSP